jgi:ABC-type transporter Mla subunit MlaD
MDTNEERERTSASGGDGAQRFSAMADDMKSAAREAAGHVADETRDFAEQQKTAGADNMARLGEAVHGAADQLGRELPQAAGFIHSAADTLQGAASSMRERSIEDLVAGFRDFARRQPAAAFAGSVLAGFALARFLKSSSPSPSERR